MAETVLWRNQWEGSTPLGAAIAHFHSLGGRLANTYEPTLITTGLGNLQDRLVAGLNGRCRTGHANSQHVLVWTIRWDYDDIKGPHVNGMFVDHGVTQRWAWCSLRQDEAPGTTTDRASYFPTLDRLTKDCGWNADKWLSLSAEDKDKYKLACAEDGLRHWTARLE